ncbi:uncharacterized protein LOC111027008 [Myzus persicae]|uniref:uncharacterized protein LOC111027008 n=1 Tax=Myzus persicae TaxID=13164 RepID=UPI000B93536F|nr:uncharacterized protein LOC111027008 [Myzus persicae]
MYALLYDEAKIASRKIVLDSHISRYDINNVWMPERYANLKGNQFEGVEFRQYPILVVNDEDNLKLYRDVMACSTNTYFHSLEQSLKEYIDYDLIKNLLHDCGISCSEIFQSDGKWQNTTLKNVCQYIQPTVLGIFGLCFTINMMPLSQMFNDEYYQR